jgi:hypothetical protein
MAEWKGGRLRLQVPQDIRDVNHFGVVMDVVS